jgi:hypothetical protein
VADGRPSFWERPSHALPDRKGSRREMMLVGQGREVANRAAISRPSLRLARLERQGLSSPALGERRHGSLAGRLVGFNHRSY